MISRFNSDKLHPHLIFGRLSIARGTPAVRCKSYTHINNMKKTLVTLLALASSAMGAVDLSSMTYTIGNASTTTEDGTFTYVLTLDAAAMRTLLEKGQAAAWGTEVMTYMCNGTLTGVVTNGGSNGGKVNTSSLYAKWGTNNAWGCCTSYSYTVEEENAETGEMTTVTKTSSYDLADLNGSAAGTGWDDVAGVGLVYAFDKLNGTTVAMTLCSADGATIFSHVITMGGLKSASAGAAAVEFGDMVTSYYYSNDVLSADDALAASGVAAVESMSVVPEPTTATLSLLALAGLAVRRRRR